MSIGVRLVDVVPFGVDTPADLEKARRILERRAMTAAEPAIADRPELTDRVPGPARRLLAHGLPAGVPRAVRPALPLVRGRVRGGARRAGALRHDPGRQHRGRPGRRRAPPAAARRPAHRRRAFRAREPSAAGRAGRHAGDVQVVESHVHAHRPVPRLPAPARLSRAGRGRHRRCRRRHRRGRRPDPRRHRLAAGGRDLRAARS